MSWQSRSLSEDVVTPSVEATVTWNCNRCAFSTSTRTITGTCTPQQHTPHGRPLIAALRACKDIGQHACLLGLPGGGQAGEGGDGDSIVGVRVQAVLDAQVDAGQQRVQRHLGHRRDARHALARLQRRPCAGSLAHQDMLCICH